VEVPEEVDTPLVVTFAAELEERNWYSLAEGETPLKLSSVEPEESLLR
jgi:hypothetical protein